MATDYFGARRRPQRERQRHQARLPEDGAGPAPRRQPRPRRQGALPGGHPRLRGAHRPGEAPHRRPRRRPVRQRERRRRGGFGGAGFGGLGDIMDAFFGGAATRGPGAAPAPGATPSSRSSWSSTRRSSGRRRTSPSTPPSSAPSARRGRRARHPPDDLHDVLGPRRGAERPARLLGQVVSSRVPHLRRYRSGHPRAVPRVRRRRSRPLAPHPAGEGARRCRGRHADPAHRAGRGRPGGGPAGDLYVEIHERPHDVFTRDGEDLHCRVTLPMTSAARTTLSLKTLDGEEDLDIRPGTQSGSVLTLRAHGAPRLRGAGRATSSSTSRSPRPPVWTPSRRSSRASWRRCAARTRPTSHREAQGGLFSRVRDAFNGR